MLQPRSGVLRVLQPVSEELDERLKRMEAENLAHAWQRHRLKALKLAVRMPSVETPEQAIEVAETFGEYILRGKPK
jgi:hypothetical protein